MFKLQRQSRISRGTLTCKCPITSLFSRMIASGADLFYPFILVIYAISLGSCAPEKTIRLPTQDNKNALVLNNNKSIVLFRLTANMDGKPLDILSDYGKDGCTAEIAKMDAYEHLKIIETAISPSPEAAKEGWAYFLLEPGTYYFVFDAVWRSPFSPYWFYVPDGGSIIYVGSLNFSCEGGSRREFSCSDLSVKDETDFAERVVSSALPEYDKLSTLLMRTFRDASSPQFGSQLLPVGILTSLRDDIKLPGSTESTLSRMTGFGYGGGGGPWGAPKDLFDPNVPVVGPLVLGLYVMYLPFGAAGGLLLGQVENAEWKSCMRQHLQNFQELDPTTEIQPAIERVIPGATIVLETGRDAFEGAKSKNLKSILHVAIAYIGVRECEERSTYCAEIAFRIRLWDVGAEGLMYDRTFVYANSTRRADAFPPYLFILPENSDCRQMSSYCDADTTDSLRQDISKGIDLLVKEVQRDLFYPSAALPNGGDAIRDDASGN